MSTIEIDHVTRTYGGFAAVDDVSFTARPGRVTGFLGPNGAGKSTTLRVLVGLTSATAGTAAGIRWMRDLLRDYANRGGTVLLSSHLLHEIEVIANDLVVIGNGRVVASGTKAELLATAGSLVRTPELDALTRALAAAAIGASPVDGGLHVDAQPERVGRIALAAGVPLVELRGADGAGLEEWFLQLTTDAQREQTHTAGNLTNGVAA